MTDRLNFYSYSSSCTVDYKNKTKIIANHSIFDSISQQLSVNCSLEYPLSIVLSPDYVTHRTRGKLTQTSVTLLIRRLPNKKKLEKRQTTLNQLVTSLRKTSRIELKIVDDELFTVTCNGQEQLFLQTILKPAVEQRIKQKLMETERKSRPPVLMIEFDGVSRRHFHRKMPQTVEFIRKNLRPESYTVVDFQKYHSLGMRL
ncbi:unnamed protein product [Didymodactylos carnosus]|uniref:Uncharacterized protein n=1 Tax=Didymodactylos carnosus TaxID=1234261 RepID=A0A8S2FGC0_9BILA|nr:unnamed protein product [Didymodactylos carnosus]CAF4252376.1 unnamed protein product [Didymodactylos carnosus]